MRTVRNAGSAKPSGSARIRQNSDARHKYMNISRCIGGPVAVALVAVAVGGIFQHQAGAIEFGDGEIQGSVDTTITHGLTFRVEDRDEGLVSDTNGNDGDLNYDRGLVSNTSKFTTDLDIDAGDFGVFVRTTGFIDFENQNGTRDRTPLSEAAKKVVGKDVELLDAYITKAFDVGDAAVDLRLGRHVLNWGESTFIPNGINAINPFDVSQLRLPGSELREALLPVSMVSMSVAPNYTTSLEGFYQIDWEETEIDSVGSYFSSTDYAGPGARKAVITTITDRLIPDIRKRDLGYGFGPLTQAINADLGTAGQPLQPAFDPNFASVLRGSDRTPSDSGQWGLVLRYLAEDLNQTEFGFHFINYHSRLPVVSAQTGPRTGIQDGLAAAGAVGGPNSITRGAAGDLASGVAQALAVDRYARSGRFYLEYPEDIQLFGLSFNTVLGTSGWALQGEYSLRRDAPLQRAERTVLEEGLRPIVTALVLGSTNPTALAPYLTHYKQERVQGYVERDVSQLQATATRVFGPTLGADALVFLTEAAVMHVHGMPEQPLESPAGGVLATEAADADATSWGYRLAARLDYSNAIGAVNLYPYTQFLHDVSGNSPAPSGPFVEGRTALALGLRADYLSRWQADLSYTRYAGDGNELSDRDFVSVSMKYSF